jgi:hypothetical protein
MYRKYQMTPAAPTAYWRKVCEENFSRLIEDLEQQVEAEVKSRVTAVLQRSTPGAAPDALPESRRALAEELNQAVRRLRKAAGIEDLYSVLLDVSVPFCDQAALFSVHEQGVRAERIRRHAVAHGGDSSAPGERLPRLEIPTSQAAAFATAIDTRDPVIAMSAPGEVSAALIRLFGNKPEERAHLFPLVVNETVVGILYATGRVQGQLLELLSEVAGLQCHIFTLASDQPARSNNAPGSRQRLSDQMVTISGAPNGTPAELSTQKPINAGQHKEWRALSRGEQHLHLAAQRFARVQVAEMRLSKLGDVRSARETSDIYQALKSPIDAAREEFREKHMTSSPTMVDYLHLELVRSLANDDAILLGPNYPGPLV